MKIYCTIFVLRSRCNLLGVTSCKSYRFTGGKSHTRIPTHANRKRVPRKMNFSFGQFEHNIIWGECAFLFYIYCDTSRRTVFSRRQFRARKRFFVSTVRAAARPPTERRVAIKIQCSWLIYGDEYDVLPLYEDCQCSFCNDSGSNFDTTIRRIRSILLDR